MKRCTKCNQEKQDTEFYKNKKGRARAYCKSCHVALSNAAMKRNREYWTAYSREWVRQNPERNMLKTARHRALRRNIPFSIDVSDIVIPEFCPILGVKLEIAIGEGPGGKSNSPSLDRIKPELGYVKGNVQVISHLANTMKANGNGKNLVAFAKWVLKNEDLLL